VLNLDLSNRVAHLGLHFAPDPSSQQTCSIGGNVANNAGGPHCLAEGVTNAHVLAMTVVLPTARSRCSAARSPSRDGYDLRGVFVGSEGMFGIATEVCVRLVPEPPAVRTLLMDFAVSRTARRR
jgi:glycolate oxidase